jgi:hypothetical protein
LNTGCISGVPVRFHCPDLNTEMARRPEKIGGNCFVRCEVCSTSSLRDENPTAGLFSGTLKFGPAHAEGTVTLPEVSGYRLIFVDSCGEEVGEAYPLMPTVDYDPGCCRGDTYQMELVDVEIPEGALSQDPKTLGMGQVVLRVMTVFGELPFGKAVNFKDDDGSGAPAPQTADASRLSFWPGVVASATLSLLSSCVGHR